MTIKPKKSRWGCLWGLLIAGALAIIVVAVLAMLGLALGRNIRSSGTAAIHGVDEYPDLHEVWSSGQGETKVVSIPLTGFIHLAAEEGLLGSTPSATQMALMAIKRATHDPAVRAIVMDIDSGGGGITASDILYRALLDFRAADPGRKIVVVYGDVAASGAYYISLAADHILARPTSITGSIGVLIQSLNLRLLGEKLGIDDVTIKSGRNKDLLNPLRDMTEEQRHMLQTIIDAMHDHFVGIVAERRRLSEAEVRLLADGSIYTADTAVERGLIDGIGYWDDAVARTAELLDVEEVKVYRYEAHFSLLGLLRARQGWNPAALLREPLSQTRLLYHWSY